jgi:hypothetical protein
MLKERTALDRRPAGAPRRAQQHQLELIHEIQVIMR